MREKNTIFVCDPTLCTGCMLCETVCAHNAVSVKDIRKSFVPQIDAGLCVKCGRCHNYCQSNADVRQKAPIKWYQGWAADDNIRKNSSSGGLATAIAKEFINNGGFVVGCIYDKGKYCLRVFSNSQDLLSASGSKYVKSVPENTYNEVKSLLKKGESVLFIGLPCQVSAIKLFVEPELHEKLYTVDLICHGAPSPDLFSNYLFENRVKTDKDTKVVFRKKSEYGIKINDAPISDFDSYIKAFLEALSHTDGCYNCKYARLERVGDITLGDAWGSDLPACEQGKGISFVMSQSEKGDRLLDKSDLHLQTVDIDRIIACNGQLVRPSNKPSRRKIFFALHKIFKFNTAVKLCYPIHYTMHKLKMTAKKLPFYTWLKQLLYGHR